MPAGRAFQVKIVGDVADAKKSLQSMEKQVKGFGKAMKGVAGLMAGAFAVQKVTQFVTGAVEQAEKMQSAYAATEQIIESTGGAAGIAAKDIKEMNRAMAFETGIAKDALYDASNVLLTFKNISSDTFKQAQELSADMATVFKTDVKSAAVQMGKALNDPIKGITALGRAGVTFTDQQKEQIATLQESGNLLGAQNIILAEMESQFGGVAAATADSTAKIGIVKDELMESVGNVMLPLLDKLATFLIDDVIPAFAKMAAWVKKHWPPIYEEYIKPVVDDIVKLIKVAWEWITKFWEENGEDIIAFIKEWAGLIIGYYVALFKLFKRVVDAALAGILWVWEHYGEQITAVVSAWWDTISTIVGFIIDVLKGLITFITAVFKGDWEGAWQAIKDIGQSVLDFFAEFPGKLVGYLASAVKLVGTAAADLGRAIINGIIGFWNKLDPRITVGPMPSWIPGIGGKQWQSPDMFPDIPKLARGGIVTGPTVAMIGEAGPEAVIPLRGSGSVGGNVIYLTVNAGVGDPVAIGQAVVDTITAFELSNGSSWRTEPAYGGV